MKLRIGQWVKVGDRVGIHLGAAKARNEAGALVEVPGFSQVNLVDEKGLHAGSVAVPPESIVTVYLEDIPEARRPASHPLYPNRPVEEVA